MGKRLTTQARKKLHKALFRVNKVVIADVRSAQMLHSKRKVMASNRKK